MLVYIRFACTNIKRDLFWICQVSEERHLTRSQPSSRKTRSPKPFFIKEINADTTLIIQDTASSYHHTFGQSEYLIKQPQEWKISQPTVSGVDVSYGHIKMGDKSCNEFQSLDAPISYNPSRIFANNQLESHACNRGNTLHPSSCLPTNNHNLHNDKRHSFSSCRVASDFQERLYRNYSMKSCPEFPDSTDYRHNPSTLKCQIIESMRLSHSSSRTSNSSGADEMYESITDIPLKDYHINEGMGFHIHYLDYMLCNDPTRKYFPKDATFV